MLFGLMSRQYLRRWEEPNIKTQKAGAQVIAYAKELTRF